MDVSIIVVNYNTSELLKECIVSVINKTMNLNYEIIVVDNASLDDSVLMVRSCFPQVILIESKENLGFGRANNKGAEVSSGKYLFLLNTDTLLINNAIKILFDFMEKASNMNVGACGGNLFKADLTPNYSYSLYFPSLFRLFCYRAHFTCLLNDEHFNKSGAIKDVAFIIGADLFVRKYIYDGLNGFDPSFFMYVEDTELSYRIKNKKYRVVSNPDANIIHLQGASSSTIYKYKNEIDSYIIYFKKYFSAYNLKLYLHIELFFVVLKLIVYAMSNNKAASSDCLSLIKFIINIIYRDEMSVKK